MPQPLGSETVTQGVRVRVVPEFRPEESDPTDRRYVFAYTVQVSNEGEDAAQLISREWTIIDAEGRRHAVQGEGVVGKQPLIEPGKSFEYTSWAPLETDWGTMEGCFTMERPDGELFDARVARFYLVAGALPVGVG